MRPNFKNIDITKDAFAHSAGKVAHEGENWITPELIPVKPVYTKEDLEGLEHLNYVAGLPPWPVQRYVCHSSVDNPSVCRFLDRRGVQCFLS